jgi:hypothetical protein
MHVEIQNINGGAQVIGPNGTVHHYGSPDGRLTSAVAELLEVVTLHRADLAEPERVRVAALAVRDEARSAQPRRERLLALLRDLAVAAGHVGAVVGAAEGVTELVQTYF